MKIYFQCRECLIRYICIYLLDLIKIITIVIITITIKRAYGKQQSEKRGKKKSGMGTGKESSLDKSGMTKNPTSKAVLSD